MNMQRVQLDISSDIFDKVMFFLENLPKNKVKLNFGNITYNNPIPTKEQNLMFGDFLQNSQKVNSVTIVSRDELNER